MPRSQWWREMRWEIRWYLRTYAQWFTADPLYFFAMIGFMLLPWFIMAYIIGQSLVWMGLV